MNMEYTHKTDYFFFAHKFVQFLQSHLEKYPNEITTNIHLSTLDDIFGHDRASFTINLDSILNIVDAYHLDTLIGDQNLVHHHDINTRKHLLTIFFNEEALRSLRAGQLIQYPKVA